MCIYVCVWSCSVCLRPSSFPVACVCGPGRVQLVWTLRPVCAARRSPHGRSGSSALTALAGLFLQPAACSVNPLTVLPVSSYTLVSFLLTLNRFKFSVSELSVILTLQVFLHLPLIYWPLLFIQPLCQLVKPACQRRQD